MNAKPYALLALVAMTLLPMNATAMYYTKTCLTEGLNIGSTTLVSSESMECGTLGGTPQPTCDDGLECIDECHFVGEGVWGVCGNDLPPEPPIGQVPSGYGGGCDASDFKASFLRHWMSVNASCDFECRGNYHVVSVLGGAIANPPTVPIVGGANTCGGGAGCVSIQACVMVGFGYGNEAASCEGNAMAEANIVTVLVSCGTWDSCGGGDNCDLASSRTFVLEAASFSLASMQPGDAVCTAAIGATTVCATILPNLVTMLVNPAGDSAYLRCTDGACVNGAFGKNP